VLSELRAAEELTKNNDRMILNMCINYGGRAEIADATARIAADVAAGKLKASGINERTISRYLYAPSMSDVDLFIRTGGEQRTSNFLMWHSAYAELYFSDLPWPEFDRRQLWQACAEYAGRERRFGGAVDKVAQATNVQANASDGVHEGENHSS
jgi:di-trans,poly-cis-decaprenylcistransferase